MRKAHRGPAADGGERARLELPELRRFTARPGAVHLRHRLGSRHGLRGARPGLRLRLQPGPGLLSLTPSEPAGWAALALVGAAAAWLNVVAGGGSFLTLSLLILMGMPPGVANGTNRVGILAQNAWAVRRFAGRGAIDWGLGARASLPAIAGAVAGAGLALAVGDEAFRRLLALLMVAMALASFLSPAPDPALRQGRVEGPWFRLGFFVVGIYGGFVQAGVGFLILAVTTFAGLDLVRGNALKMLVALAFTPLALLLFAAGGRVEWAPGLALAAGSLVGADLGVRFAIGRSQRTLQLVVDVALVAFALRLWFE